MLPGERRREAHVTPDRGFFGFVGIIVGSLMLANLVVDISGAYQRRPWRPK
jgi:hypothetical protein